MLKKYHTYSSFYKNTFLIYIFFVILNNYLLLTTFKIELLYLFYNFIVIKTVFNHLFILYYKINKKTCVKKILKDNQKT